MDYTGLQTYYRQQREGGSGEHIYEMDQQHTLLEIIFQFPGTMQARA